MIHSCQGAHQEYKSIKDTLSLQRPRSSHRPSRCLHVPHATRWRYPASRPYGSCGGAGRSLSPRPGLFTKPATPCSKNRCAHL
jgi:hypothetical protein